MDTVIRAQVLDDYFLQLTFSNAETRMFDAKPYLQRGAFRKLLDPTLFRQAYVAFDTVCWPDGFDIAPETLYDQSIPIKEGIAA